MNAPFLPYTKQCLSQEDKEAVFSSLSSEVITRGPRVLEFEKKISSYVGAPYTVVFNSGSTALAAAYFACDTTREDQIITTPITFMATLSQGLLRGASVRFADIEKKSANISMDSLISLLGEPHSRGKKILSLVHMGGLALPMKGFFNSIKDPNTVIIEDAAHAIGSSYPTGEKVGCGLYSDMTIFSFHPAKTITTGEGGAVTTRSKDLYERLVLFRNNGIKRSSSSIWSYDVEAFSSNFHMTEFQAALGCSQLATIEQKIAKRAALMEAYHSLVGRKGYFSLLGKEGLGRSAWHLCIAKIPFKKWGFTRDAFMEALRQKGIGTQLHYIPLYRFSAVKKKVGELFLEEAETYFEEALSLPLYFEMTVQDVQRVVAEVEALSA